MIAPGYKLGEQQFKCADLTSNHSKAKTTTTKTKKTIA
jgi:hypothetical protein